MKLKTVLATATLLATGSAVAEKPALSWEQLREPYQCPEWFADARLGIWCPWGAQTAPAQGGGWYARHMFMPDVKNEDWGRDERIEYRQKKDALTFKVPTKRPTRFITFFKAEMK